MADVVAAAPHRRDNEEDESEEERRQRLHEEEIERMLLQGEQQDDDNVAAGIENEEDEHEIVFQQDDDDNDEQRPLLDDADDGFPDDDNDDNNILEPPPAAVAGQQPNTIFKRFSYFETSMGAAIALLYYAFRTRQQWYLALVFLASTKFSLVVFGNALVALAIATFDIVTNKMFLQGGLRIQEAEGLQDFFRWNVTETCLALTMFRSELKLQTAIEFLCLIWIKCLHHVAVLRETHVRMTQESIEPRPIFGFGAQTEWPVVPYSHVKVWTLLFLLQWIDLWIVQYTGVDLIQVGPSVNILFCFEAAILLISAWSHLLLLYLHLIDGFLNYLHDKYRNIGTLTRLLHFWKEYKATLTFAVELQAQAIQFIFYLSFFAIVLTYYGMPINLFREVYVSFTALKERLVAFLKYRRLMASMNRFKSATEEQLLSNQNANNAEGEGGDDDDELFPQQRNVCIICRDEMTIHEDIKILPVCEHMFHKSCLREWLVQQQSCPTCRSDIAAMEAQEASRQATEAAAAARAATNAEQQQQQQDQPPAEEQAGQQQPQLPAGVSPQAAAGGGGGGGPAVPPVPQQAQLKPPPGQAQQLPALQQPMMTTAGRSLEEIRRLREQRELQQQAAAAVAAATTGETKKVRFPPEPAAAAAAMGATETFPALFRVTLESGAQVFDDNGILQRTIAPGRIVLCLDQKQTLQVGRILLRIPDGYVPEDTVSRVHSIQAW